MNKGQIVVIAIVATIIMLPMQYAAWYFQPILGDYGPGASVTMGAIAAFVVMFIGLSLRGTEE